MPARSNPAASAWGATVSIKGAGGTIHELAGEGSAGPLDVVARTEADYHQRILPGLTITAMAGKDGMVTL